MNIIIMSIALIIALPCVNAQAFESMSSSKKANLIDDIELVHVPGACFKMGDRNGDGRYNEKSVHEVCVDSFQIGKYEVTQAQWKKVMGSNPSNFKNCGDKCPVENVSWNDVQKFISKLNKLSKSKYRLPTEAEWEFACRSGGKDEKYCGSVAADEVGWHKNNSGNKTHLVGQKRPNGLGIYDMSGNVWEYVADYYEESYTPVKNNPTGPVKGVSDHVYRGGSYLGPDDFLRATGRGPISSKLAAPNIGFRLVLPVSK